MKVLQKAVNWYKSVNKLWFTAVVSTVLLVLSSFWNPFVYLMMAFVLFNLIFMDYGQAIALNFFFLAYTGFLIPYIGLPLLTFIVFVVKYAIDLKHKTKKVFWFPLITTVAISTVFSAIHYQINDYGALQGVLFVGVFFMLYLAFVYRQSLNADAIFRSLIYGVISSAVLGGILYFVPFAKMYTWDNWEFGFVTVAQRFTFAAAVTYTRFQFLCFHPNHLYCLAIMGISYIVYWFLQRQPKSIKDIILNCLEFVGLSVVGFMTMSKGFFVLFALVMIFALVMMIVTYKRKSLIFVLPALSLLAIVAVVFRDYFLTIIGRFFGNGEDILSSITTGRTDIWKKFLQETFSTPWKALFGVGLFTKDIVDIGPHSLYIAILYRVGVVGTLALGVLVFSYVYVGKKKLKFSLIKWFPMAVFLICALQESCVDERLFFFLAILPLAFGDASEAQCDAPSNAQDIAAAELRDSENSSDKENLQQNAQSEQLQADALNNEGGLDM